MKRPATCLFLLLASTAAMAQRDSPRTSVTTRNATDMPMFVTLERAGKAARGECVMPGAQLPWALEPNLALPTVRARAAPGPTCREPPVCDTRIELRPGMEVIELAGDARACGWRLASVRGGPPPGAAPGKASPPPRGHRLVELQNEGDKPVLARLHLDEFSRSLVKQTCVLPRMRQQLWLPDKPLQLSGERMAGANCTGPVECPGEGERIRPGSVYAAWTASRAGCAWRSAPGPNERLPLQGCVLGDPPCLQ